MSMIGGLKRITTLCILTIIYFLGIGMMAFFLKLFGVKKSEKKGWVSRENMKIGLLEEMF